MPRFHNFLIIAVICLAACSVEPPDPVADPPSHQYVEKGRRLAKGLAACGFCHSADGEPQSLLSGGRLMRDGYGDFEVPNISPAANALKDWSTLDIINLMRSGIRPDGDRISGELHSGFEWMSDADLLAIISYLKSIPPVKNDFESRTIGMLARNTIGFFEGESRVSGYVPEIDKADQLAYGQYIANHLARCGVCHDTPATVFESVVPLGGGRMIRIADEAKVAPNISQARNSGIGNWSEEQIVSFLQSGETPSGKSVDQDFCPVGFYANALPEDLVSLAKYLKSIDTDE